VKTAIIAWGSIIWDPGNLALAGTFEPTGPTLPIEFCRVSRDGRLTLVIDEKLGTVCPTRVATSGFDEARRTIKDLSDRENTNEKNIGFIDCSEGIDSAGARGTYYQALENIRSWAGASNYDAAVWTALASNFSELGNANAEFSVNAAINYLDTLGAKRFERALAYIRNAPPEVRTPVRAAVDARWP
jgi:hypothetical protein